MTRIAYQRRGLVRCLSFAAAAALMLAAAPGQRAEAMSLITPSASPVTKNATEGMLIEVHGGGGGGGGGGHGGGGGMHSGGGGGGGGGMHFGGGGGAMSHGGGFHEGFHGGFHRHFFGGGGYYPYDDYPYYDEPYYYSSYPACRIVVTAYGPRRICWHHWHRGYYRHHHHHRHY